MELTTLSRFARDLIDSRRVPLSGTLELTFRCNLKCSFCYCPGGRDQAPHAELAVQEVRRIVAEIADAGCLTLLLTGGEPLLRRDFKEIYRYVRHRGIIVTLYTNGTLMSESVADVLCEFPPRRVEVTLYGATERTYEAVTRIAGSFGACLRGIDLLMERRLPLALKSTVSIHNAHEIPIMQEFAKSRGLEYRYDPILDPRIDGDMVPCGFRLSPHDIVELDSRDLDKIIDIRRLCARKPEGVDRSLVYACGAGENSFHIDPYGNMSMCAMTRYAAYDLRKGSFARGFQDHFLHLRSQRFQEGQAPPCATCNLINLCTNCPGTAFLENGSLNQPSQFHCEVAQLRDRTAAAVG